MTSPMAASAVFSPMRSLSARRMRRSSSRGVEVEDARLIPERFRLPEGAPRRRQLLELHLELFRAGAIDRRDGFGEGALGTGRQAGKERPGNRQIVDRAQQILHPTERGERAFDTLSGKQRGDTDGTITERLQSFAQGVALLNRQTF